VGTGGAAKTRKYKEDVRLKEKDNAEKRSKTKWKNRECGNI